MDNAAYNEGKAGYANDQDVNPYQEGSEEHKSWERGWEDACFEIKEPLDLWTSQG